MVTLTLPADDVLKLWYAVRGFCEFTHTARQLGKPTIRVEDSTEVERLASVLSDSMRAAGVAPYPIFSTASA